MRHRRSAGRPVPPEYTHRPERVPPARSALAFVHREMKPARVWILERPAAIGVALRLQEADRLRDPLVRSGACRAQIVETTEHVAVPAGRERELSPGRGDPLPGGQPTQHPPLDKVFLAPKACSSYLGPAALR